jgi:hypothetical protein
MVLPVAARRILHLLVGLEVPVMNVKTSWALMALTVPAVAPSAPFIQKQKEKPAAGTLDVPIKLPRLIPAPTFIVNPCEVELGTTTPEKLVPPEFAKYAAPAPGKGLSTVESYVGGDPAFTAASAYPFPLASL